MDRRSRIGSTNQRRKIEVAIFNKFIYWSDYEDRVIQPFELFDFVDDLKKLRFRKVQNVSAFQITNTRSYMFDCYHDNVHYNTIKHQSEKEIQRSIGESITKITNIKYGNIYSDKIKVCSEFSESSFKLLLQEQSQLRDEIITLNRLLPKRLKNRIKKLENATKIASRVACLKAQTGFTNAKICKQLKLSKNFFNYTLDLIKNPSRIAQIQQKDEEAKDMLIDNNQKFVQFFKFHNTKYRTRQMLLNKFKQAHNSVIVNSLSDFDCKFIKANNISYQKGKLVYGQVNESKKDHCRVGFIEQFLNLIQTKQNVYFFDETTFQINSSVFYSYSFKGVRPTTRVKPQPIYLRLLLIVSLSKIEAAVFSTEPVNSDFIYTFLRHFVHRLQTKADIRQTSNIIVMDNSPKNRIAEVKELAHAGRANLMFTVPCSPFTNFIETVFNKIKGNLKRLERFPFA